MVVFFKNTTDCLLTYYLEVGVSYPLKIEKSKSNNVAYAFAIEFEHY